MADFAIFEITRTAWVKRVPKIQNGRKCSSLESNKFMEQFFDCTVYYCCSSSNQTVEKLKADATFTLSLSTTELQSTEQTFVLLLK